MALLVSACSFNRTINDINKGQNSTDPLSFQSGSVLDDAQTKASSDMLKSDFAVSTYKKYGATDWSTSLHTVMDRYYVSFKENRDDWSGVVTSNWNYIDVDNPWTGKRQEEKFWDYSAFPYRFHAVAPANGNTFNKDQITSLGTDALGINATFRAQSFMAPASADASLLTKANTVTTPGNKDAEPYLVAQVARDANGADRDIVKGAAINSGSTSRNRRVALPFHHLNSRVRFGVYTLSLYQISQHDYISDMVIRVEKLATVATSYKAYGQDSWVSDYGFSGFQGIGVEDNQTILTFNPSPSDAVAAPRSYAENDLSLHQGKSSAYWLECPDGIMQLPQNGIKLHVSLTVRNESGEEHFYFHDYEIQKGDSDIDPTHWVAGYMHTYYLCLTLDDQGLPIMTVTATLTPWEEVSGSLSTDLEK